MDGGSARMRNHNSNREVIMENRKMLLRSVLALGMGWTGLVHARNADAADARLAANATFDQCHTCLQYGCGGAFQFCLNNGCNTSMIGCGNFGNCGGDYAVVSCNDSNY